MLPTSTAIHQIEAANLIHDSGGFSCLQIRAVMMDSRNGMPLLFLHWFCLRNRWRGWWPWDFTETMGDWGFRKQWRGRESGGRDILRNQTIWNSGWQWKWRLFWIWIVDLGLFRWFINNYFLEIIYFLLFPISYPNKKCDRECGSNCNLNPCILDSDLCM